MEEARYKTMAACQRFSAELDAHLDGEASPFVAAHAPQCAPCNALLADLQMIRQAARELPQEEPSPAVWANLRQKLAAQRDLAVSPCVQFSSQLQDYLEGETRPFIASHAQECPSCNDLLADMHLIPVAARDLPLEEPSPAVWTSLRSKLESLGAFEPSPCVQFSDGLEAYLEGEANPLIAVHAQGCEPCKALLADLESIRAAARDLPQEEPSRMVWANVRAQLEAEGAFGTPVSGWRKLFSWQFAPQPAPLGALAGLVVLAVVLSLPSGDLQSGNSPQQAASSSEVSQVAELAPPAEDVSLAHVVSDLESNFKASEASMTPELKATYDKSLVSLNGSIRECLDSLHHEPGNTLAHDYLLTAYTRKAEVLSSALEFEGR